MSCHATMPCHATPHQTKHEPTPLHPIAPLHSVLTVKLLKLRCKLCRSGNCSKMSPGKGQAICQPRRLRDVSRPSTSQLPNWQRSVSTAGPPLLLAPSPPEAADAWLALFHSLQDSWAWQHLQPQAATRESGAWCWAMCKQALLVLTHPVCVGFGHFSVLSSPSLVRWFSSVQNQFPAKRTQALVS